MEKGQKVQIEIVDMTKEGAGLGRYEGMAVFVKGAVVGDFVEAELTKVKKNYAFGRLIEILEPSEGRIENPCPYFKFCGGCAYGELDYETQLALKEKQVKDKLERLGGLTDPKMQPIRGMDDPYRYRNKATMSVWTGGIITRKGGIIENLGEPQVGFIKGKSHDVFDCYDCYLQSEPAMAAAEALRQFMETDNITAYDSKWEKGLMRNLIVKTAKGTGQVMVIYVINGKGIPNVDKLVELTDDFIYSLPETEDGIKYSLESVIININKDKQRKYIMGEENLTIAGRGTIQEYCGGLNFEISPHSFYQVNPTQMEVLYGIAMDYADFKGGETVLDLYCGVGTIGLFAVAAGAGRVVGIETIKGAVLDANRNAVINGIVNARYVLGKAEDELPKLLSGEGLKDETLKVDHADVVFLDPPRAGCEESLLATVCKAAPEKIVYISCDPATLARDLKYLTANGYEFIEATPVDMFSWTDHVESVVLLTRA